MDSLFKSSSNFASLSLKDLLEARDLFHYHLMNKKNVAATAVGLYRIRKADPWPSKDSPALGNPHKLKSERRTLFNSEVRPYSWPCVYVFVSCWEYEEDLSGSNPSDVVPKSLYLPDGRAVPVCVIEARKQHFSKDMQVRADSRTPRNLLGPGSAIINKNSQGMERLATAGCLVRDGERYYVLTNRHAAGEPGTPIFALQSHREIEIGVSAQKGLTRMDFSKVYPNFKSTKQYLRMDAGLVDIDDILAWKTDVPGIAPSGPVLDLYDNSLTLKLIGMKVVGQSAVSGLIRGEIAGLFYRYKAMGGSEYISDFLIGPETCREAAAKEKEEAEKKDLDMNVALGVHHGDSGTLLFVEHIERQAGHKTKTTIYYPFALLWGKEEFFDNGTVKSHPYALATSLSTALDHLDLDMVQGINLDQDYIWGWVGHYVIGRALPLPADLFTSKRLQDFISKNIDLLSLQPDSALDNDPKVLTQGSSRASFVPLADVPDNVWKSNVNFTSVEGDDGKRHHNPGPGSRGQDDNKNHFADLDLPYKDRKTFLELNAENPDTYLKPSAWLAYFAAMEPRFEEWDGLLKGASKGEEAKDGRAHWGALPFRVKQLFDTMVKAAREGNEKLFICAGGVLIHYIGDACQPLHASYLSQGDPARVVKRPKSDRMKLEADGVHSGYEDDMVAYGFKNDGLAAKLKARISNLKNEPAADVKNGFEAAKAVIALIAATQKEIAPRAIVDKWVSLQTTPKREKIEAMWEEFGGDTITCMARGTRYLAKIWQAAWDAGNGDAKIGGGSEIDKQDIMDLYNNSNIVPSVALDQYPDDMSADWSVIQRSHGLTSAKKLPQAKPHLEGHAQPLPPNAKRKKNEGLEKSAD
jgi:hypothetical protein